MEAMKLRRRHISDEEFERKFNETLDKDLSKLSPKERRARTRKAYQTALRVCRANPATTSRSDETRVTHLVARNREE
jgi:hypothetical protein